MATNKGTFTGEYQPNNIKYTYVYDLQTYIPDYTSLELSVLESHGYDASYPSQWCQTKVYGNTEQAVAGVLNFNATSFSPLVPSGVDPTSPYYVPTTKEYEDGSINLSRPLRDQMNAATTFTSGMKFGQPAGDDVPSEIQIETDRENRRSSIKWYKNGALVATDTLQHMVSGSSVKIAIAMSGNTATGYAYLFGGLDEDDSSAVWTSGLKSNADVLAIINTMGFAGENTTMHGFTDEDMGDFILSLIYRYDGADAKTGQASDSVSGTGRPAAALTNLEGKCEQYGGYLGTDLIEYMSEGQGWAYLKTQADNNTPVQVQIPTAVEGKYVTIKCENIGGSGPYFSFYDADGVMQGYIATSIYERGQGKAFLTWYPQSAGFNASSEIIMCYYGDNNTQGQYQFATFDIAGQGAEFEEFDNESAFKNGIQGFDPEGGQEDEDQDDPEDVDDPAYDALADGFLYAFMVDSGDMEHLNEALVPDTLAQKIRADFGNNLFDFIVSYHIMPCLTNADSLNKTAIAYRGQPFVYGENDTQLMLAPITNSYYTIGCGSRVCWPSGTRPDGFENWAEANIQLYLPFIGYVHLNTADVWKKTITVSYKFDILQGTCVANIGVSGAGTIYSYEGSCKYSIPFTSIIDHSNAQLLSGIMSSAGAAVSIGGVIAGGSPAGLVSAAGNIADAAGGFISAVQHKSTINRGGCLSGAPGWQMPRKPALIITVPNYIQPGMVYNDLNGYPTFQTGMISNWINNYIECGQVKLEAAANGSGAVPNDNELDLIKTLLKGGVYV